ncbi:hypothetical protein H5410_041098 [Solanum commersonii]|uniref:Uncharacterized protein n=1 Tax=Solanum commersonii TaxID=4109 RepID=A0A9J5XTV0_SOLCO|nr:hypothetical protein H5410_041098 [Solanum commersonii]
MATGHPSSADFPPLANTSFYNFYKAIHQQLKPNHILNLFPLKSSIIIMVFLKLLGPNEYHRESPMLENSYMELEELWIQIPPKQCNIKG